MFSDPKIVTINDKKLVGHSVIMSLVDNKNTELFSGFMPNKKQIINTVGKEVYEVLEYDSLNYFSQFNPNTTFKKWATVQVLNYNSIPEGMETYDLKGGLNAKFHYKGLAQDFGKLMQYILMEWLPKSNYVLDDRAHFHVLDEKTIKHSPDSEEDFYIPIKMKS